jgi:hypothetical protein
MTLADRQITVEVIEQMSMNLEITLNETALVPVWPIPIMYHVHGKGGSLNGTIKKLATVLEKRWPGLDFFRSDFKGQPSSI